jgi:spermidine/putrescine transport system ATP-binding protein/putrescine transport system ATP-binding protein
MAHGGVEQVDAPVDLYERPRTLFVARFVGDNDFFRGRAVAGGLEVPGLGILPASHQLAAGTDAWLAIRPEEVQVVGPGDGLLRGIVIDTLFQGGISTLAVEVTGCDGPVMVSQHGATRIERDTAVGLSWDARRTVVLPA